MKITKKSALLMLGIILLMFLLAITESNNMNIALAENPAIGSTTPSIIVSGKGAVTAVPDTAYVNIGILAENLVLNTAQVEAKDKMNKIVNELKTLGVKDEDMKTINYNVNPKYDWSNNTQKIIGYTVSNMMEVRINDIDKAGNILDSVVGAGSNMVNGIRFGLKDETELYNKALELAVEDAKAKAKAIGKPINATNLKPLKVSETSSRYTPFLENSMYKQMDSMAVSTPISQGELEIEANVSVEFGF